MKKLNPNARLLFVACSVIILVLLLSPSCTQKGTDNVVTSISLTKMNVLYVGVDNPVVVAVSGYNSDEIEVSVLDEAAKITVTGEKGQYILNPKRPGTLTMVVKAKGVVVQEAMFRVKAMPDPAAMVAGKKGGKIEKDVLLEQKEISVVMENFDFDLKFTIQSFTFSTTNKKGYYRSLPVQGSVFSQELLNLFKNIKSGERFNIEDIKVIGPDGGIRDLPSIVFEII